MSLSSAVSTSTCNVWADLFSFNFQVAHAGVAAAHSLSPAGSAAAVAAAAAAASISSTTTSGEYDYRRSHGSVVIDDDTNRILTALMNISSSELTRSHKPAIEELVAYGALCEFPTIC